MRRAAPDTPPGKLTFDKLSSVFATGNATRDDAPNHIRLREQVPLDISWPVPRRPYEGIGKDGLYGAVAADVRAALTGLPAGQRRNLLVFANYLGPLSEAGGQAVKWGDDRPGPENLANDGGIEALVYGWGRPWFVASSLEPAAEVVVHEVLHNLGAVQDSAPHSTLASHCFDEWDIECYADARQRSASPHRPGQGAGPRDLPGQADRHRRRGNRRHHGR